MQTSDALKKDWTHWTQETYLQATRLWSSFYRAGIDENDDTEDGREFKRLWENTDQYETWCWEHEFPFQRVYLVPGESVEGDENDWQMVSGPPPVVHHKPSSSMFQIEYNKEDVAEDGSFPVSSLYAVMIHVCKDRSIPSDVERVLLGKLAIAFWYSGMWKKGGHLDMEENGTAGVACDSANGAHTGDV